MLDASVGAGAGCDNARPAIPQLSAHVRHRHDHHLPHLDVRRLRLHLQRGQGLPEEGIAPGTRWDDVPDSWTCPDCGVTKDDFEMMEL